MSTYLKNWTPSRLQQTKLKIIDGDERCVQALGKYEESRIYCAHDIVRQSNICMGDSGGPLMYYSGGKWYLYGLTSFLSALNDRCLNTEPSFFTKVPIYVNSSNQIEFDGNWIEGPFYRMQNFIPKTSTASTFKVQNTETTTTEKIQTLSN